MSGAKEAKDKGGGRPRAVVIFREAALRQVLTALCENGYTFDAVRRMTMQELNEVYDSLYFADEQAEERR